MRNDNGSTEAARQYAVAYEVHYEAKDLCEALSLYKHIVVAHRETREAGYARSQIQNIVNSVVPEQEIFDVQMDLALAYLQKH